MGEKGADWDGMEILLEPLAGSGVVRVGSQEPVDYRAGETGLPIGLWVVVLCPFSSRFLCELPWLQSSVMCHSISKRSYRNQTIAYSARWLLCSVRWTKSYSDQLRKT